MPKEVWCRSCNRFFKPIEEYETYFVEYSIKANIYGSHSIHHAKQDCDIEEP